MILFPAVRAQTGPLARAAIFTFLQLWDVYVLYKCLLYMEGGRVVRRRCTCVGEGERSENLIFRHQRVGE